MRKSIHALTMECSAAARPGDEATDASFGASGRQDWRREAEVAPEHLREQQELDAAREWLRHVEAGRIG
jgi:hypothetical protein